MFSKASFVEILQFGRIISIGFSCSEIFLKTSPLPKASQDSPWINIGTSDPKDKAILKSSFDLSS